MKIKNTTFTSCAYIEVPVTIEVTSYIREVDEAGYVCSEEVDYKLTAVELPDNLEELFFHSDSTEHLDKQAIEEAISYLGSEHESRMEDLASLHDDDHLYG